MDSAVVRVRRSRRAIAAAVVGIVLVCLWATPPRVSAFDDVVQGFSGTITGSKVLWTGNIPGGSEAAMTVAGTVVDVVPSGGGNPTVGWVCGSVRYGRETINTRVFVIGTMNSNGALLGWTPANKLCSVTWEWAGSAVNVSISASVTLHAVTWEPNPSLPIETPDPSLGGSAPPTSSPSFFPSNSPAPSGSAAGYWLCWSTVPGGVGPPLPISSPVAGDSTCRDQNGSPAPSSSASGGPPTPTCVIAFSNAASGTYGVNGSGSCVVYSGDVWAYSGTAYMGWSDSLRLMLGGQGAASGYWTGTGGVGGQTGYITNGADGMHTTSASGTGTVMSNGAGQSWGGLVHSDNHGSGSITVTLTTPGSGRPSASPGPCAVGGFGGTPLPSSTCVPASPGASSSLSDGVCYETRYYGGGVPVLVAVPCVATSAGAGPGVYSCAFPGGLNPFDYLAWIGCNIAGIPGSIADLLHDITGAIASMPGAIAAALSGLVGAIGDLGALIIGLPGLIASAVENTLGVFLDRVIGFFLPPDNLGDHVALIGAQFADRVPFGLVGQVSTALEAVSLPAGSLDLPTLDIAGQHIAVTAAWASAAAAIGPYRGALTGGIFFFLVLGIADTLRGALGGGSGHKSEGD